LSDDFPSPEIEVEKEGKETKKVSALADLQSRRPTQTLKLRNS